MASIDDSIPVRLRRRQLSTPAASPTDRRVSLSGDPAILDKSPLPRVQETARSGASSSAVRLRRQREDSVLLSERPTIRGFRVAFADTPPKLRELEEGWRARRRAALGDVSARAGNGISEATRSEDGAKRGDPAEKAGPWRAGSAEILPAVRTQGGEQLPTAGHGPLTNRGTGLHAAPRSADRSEPRIVLKKAEHTRHAPPAISPLTPPLTPPISPLPVRRHAQHRSMTPAMTIPPPLLQSSPPAIEHQPEATLQPDTRKTKISSAERTSPARISAEASPSQPPLRRTVPAHPSRPLEVRTILAHPLPSSSRPVPITRNSKDSIHVYPPGTGFELALRLTDSRTFRVRRGGESVEIENTNDLGGLRQRHAGPAARRASDRQIPPGSINLRLSDSSSWGRSERDQWEAIRALVEGFKRRTPRVRIFHPLGQLSVTCSDPPDVVLAFDTVEREGGEAVETKRAVHATESPRAAMDRNIPDETSWAIKVRVTLSRCILSMRIDTTSARIGGSNGEDHRHTASGETYRSRRIVALPEPPVAASMGVSAREGDSLEVSHCFGLRGMEGWRREEVEGVRRLWNVRAEWERYG